jgi:hypothetical protein
MKDLSIFFFVINMNKNIDRYFSISNSLDKIGCKYERIEAIDGFNMESDIYCKKILACRTKFLNRKFEYILLNQSWIYDGTIKTSFPGLNIYGHEGTKGLTLSNLKAFERALELNYKWYFIIEDDAIINIDIYNKICDFLQQKENINLDIVLLDKRSDGWGGTAGIIYNKDKINYFFENLHPLSNFSIQMEKKYNSSCLWDWKLWMFIKTRDKYCVPINFACFPCIDSGNFDSTINI